MHRVPFSFIEVFFGVMKSSAFVILHFKNPVKSNDPSFLNIKFSCELTYKPLEKNHFVLYKIWCRSIDFIEVNKKYWLHFGYKNITDEVDYVDNQS